MSIVYFFDNGKRPFLHKSKSDILQMSDYHKNQVKEDVIDIIESLEDDYEIDCPITDSQLDYILDGFYQYYREKQITFYFVENMKHHFGDMEIDAIEEKCAFDANFILDKLRLYELLESQIEVNPNDTKKLVRNIKTLIKTRRLDNGE